MNRIARGLLVALIVSWSGLAVAEIKTSEISYSGDGIEMKGYIAWDDRAGGPRPGVLVVHEWWGHNDYARLRARMLAELGYTGMALDMYGGGKQAGHPEEAGAFAGAAMENREGARARFNAALETLKSHPSVDPSKTAAIGYCFGGGVVLHAARYGADLDAVASFHGSLGPGIAPEGEGGEVKARVVVYNGEDDSFVSREQIDALAAEMKAAGADYQFINLPGAIHGFSNPEADRAAEKFGLKVAYNRLADEASWAHMQLVFNKVFAE